MSDAATLTAIATAIRNGTPASADDLEQIALRVRRMERSLDEIYQNAREQAELDHAAVVRLRAVPVRPACVIIPMMQPWKGPALGMRGREE